MRKILLFSILTTVLSCSGGEGENKLWWILFGFPLLGLAFFVGAIARGAMSSSKEKDDENDVVINIVVGVIILSIIYFIFKSIL